MSRRRRLPLLGIATLAISLTACAWPFGGGTTQTADINPFPAPSPGEGIQLHVGPFDVPQGSEVQKNFYFKLPSDKDIEITKVQFHFAPGSHHCNLFKSDTDDVADHVEDTFNAIAYETYDMWAASQQATGEIDFPAGYTLPMKAHQQLIFQTHYVNGQTQATLGNKGDVKVNIYYKVKDPSKTYPHVGMLFAINKTLAIPPHTLGYVATKSVTFDATRFPNGTTLFAMTGHFHSRGKKFQVYRYDNNVKGDLIYENDTWSEPPYKTYDPALNIQAGGKFIYECTFDNTSDATVSFGPRVETQEHANAFMYFYPGPADGHAFYDIDGGMKTQ